MSVTERATQRRSAGWRSCDPTQNLIGPDRPAVIAEIRISLRCYYCAFQGHAGKETFAAKNESRFEDGHDREPFGMSQHISWDSFFWHLSKIANDHSAMVDDTLFGGASCDEREK